MDPEEEKPPHIRNAYLVLDAFWFLFSLGLIALSYQYIQLIEEGDIIFSFTRFLSLSLAVFSILSIIIVVYALFLKKEAREMSLSERLKNSRYRYLIFLFFLFAAGILPYYTERNSHSYESMVLSTLFVLLMSFFLPPLVFFLSFKSSGKGLIKTMKEYLFTSFFFSLVLLIMISSYITISPFLSPQVSFYKVDDRSWTYYYGSENGTVASLGIANNGIFPAKDIDIMENGTKLSHVDLLRGGTYRLVDVKINCEKNESYENETYLNDTYYDEELPCEVNITLLYNGNVSDEIEVLYPYENECTDTILIIMAPLMLVNKKMRKKSA
jgi:hypothetical protein